MFHLSDGFTNMYASRFFLLILNNGSLFYALCMITFYWLIVWWMDKKKIYVKV